MSIDIYARALSCIDTLAALGISIEREMELRYAVALLRGAWVRGGR